jgi:hypothetical protein
MTPNARFTYMYRDGANYKKGNAVVFPNPERVSLASMKNRLQDVFLVDATFVADQIRLPEVFLYSDGRITSHDHCLHEFCSIEETQDTPNDRYGRSILAFVLEVETVAKIGWYGFTPGAETKDRFKLTF